MSAKKKSAKSVKIAKLPKSANLYHDIIKSTKWLNCKLYLQQLQHRRRETGTVDRRPETVDGRQETRNRETGDWRKE